MYKKLSVSSSRIQKLEKFELTDQKPKTIKKIQSKNKQHELLTSTCNGTIIFLLSLTNIYLKQR